MEEMGEISSEFRLLSKSVGKVFVVCHCLAVCDWYRILEQMSIEYAVKMKTE